MRWLDYQGIEVPVSSTAGPRDPYADAAAGFDHSPQGAALAAIGATIRISVAPDAQWPTIVATLVAPGEGRDQWAVSRALVSITDPVNSADAPQVLGYRIENYTEQAATVTVFSRQPDASITATTTRVVWSGGDWKLLLPTPVDTAAVQEALDAAPASMVTLPR